MRTIALLVSAVACAVSLVRFALASPPLDNLVFEHANLIDGVSTQPLRDVTVAVQGGRIVSVSSGPVKESAE